MGQASEECESNRSFAAPLSHMYAHGDAHFVSQQHDDGTFERGTKKDHSGLGDECIEEQHKVSGLTEYNGVINTRVESCSDEMGHDNVDVEEATNELVADQEEINQRQDTTGDPLPSVVQIDNLENVVFNCAPGENNIPKYLHSLICFHMLWCISLKEK